VPRKYVRQNEKLTRLKRQIENLARLKSTVDMAEFALEARNLFGGYKGYVNLLRDLYFQAEEGSELRLKVLRTIFEIEKKAAEISAGIDTFDAAASLMNREQLLEMLVQEIGYDPLALDPAMAERLIGQAAKGSGKERADRDCIDVTSQDADRGASKGGSPSDAGP
jgi:hypothetical protein